MPTYVYETLDEPIERFEIRQSMSEPALTKHPQTDRPIRRVLTPPTLLGANSDHAINRDLNDSATLAKAGFGKYKKTSDGHYERVAGKGPKTVRRD